MPSINKTGLLASLLAAFTIYLSPAQAAMQNTEDLLSKPDRAQLVRMLEREDVRQELVKMGVNPSDAISRVKNMTDEEVAELNNRIAKLPAGAGVSNLELLLIIIIIILLV